jgi:hypothetical protein
MTSIKYSAPARNSEIKTSAPAKNSEFPLEFLAGAEYSQNFRWGQIHFVDGIFSTSAKNSTLLKTQWIDGTVNGVNVLPCHIENGLLGL